MYTASDLRKGLRILLDDDPYIITEFNFVKPGKGQSLYRCKLRNMLQGNLIERTFREVDTFQPADLAEKKMQYLYREEDKYYFMDNESFEQIFMSEDQLEDEKNYLLDNIEVKILIFRERPIGITLPNSVDLRVVEAEPYAKNDSVSGDYKPVILETGYRILVPPFVNSGDKIRVDTRSGEYLTRVKD